MTSIAFITTDFPLCLLIPEYKQALRYIPISELIDISLRRQKKSKFEQEQTGLVWDYAPTAVNLGSVLLQLHFITSFAITQKYKQKKQVKQ